MNKWVVLSVLSLAGISLFSLYVGMHIAQGIICQYVHLMPYLLPVVYVLGFVLGYSLIQIKQEGVKPGHLAGVFEGDDREAVKLALEGGTQADLAGRIGKVRAHRAVKGLATRGLLEREEHGNTYRLMPGKKLRKLLKR